MKGRAVAFFLIFVLALGFFCAGGGLLWARRNGLALSGELALGERGGAEGAKLALRAALEGHLVWDAEYSPATGSTESAARWQLAREDLYEPDDSPTLSLASMSYVCSWAGSLPESLAGASDDPANGRFLSYWLEPAYQRFLADARASGLRDREYPLGDFSDRVPLGAFASGGVSGTEALAERFRLPAEGLTLRVDCVQNPANDTIQLNFSIPGLEEHCASVYAPSGWLYFSFDMRSEGERLSGELLPGGGWGVWRVRCTPESGADTSSERWWMSEDIDYTCEPDTLERVCAFSGDWELHALRLSGDGGRVLLTGVRDGALSLRALDAVTGETLQDLPLGVEGGYVEGIYDGEGWAVFQIYAGREASLLCCGEDAGRYTPRMTAPLALPGRPESLRELPEDYFSWSVTDARFDGERLCVLYEISCAPDWGSTLWYVLSVFDEDGAVYTEWLPSLPFASLWSLKAE